MRIDPAHRAESRRLTRELARVGFVLPGTLLYRQARCGKARCRCHGEPPVLHGPYWSWTRKVSAKTVTRRLSDEQREDFQPWFDNARELRRLSSELETLCLAVVDADPRWEVR